MISRATSSADHRMHAIGIEDGEAHLALAGEGRADADLDRFLGIDHPVLHRIVEHRSVIDPPAIIGLDIAMRVEMDERQGPVTLGMRLEQGIGHIVIAAEGQHLGAARDDLAPHALR